MSAPTDSRRRALVLRELLGVVLQGSGYIKTGQIARRTPLSSQQVGSFLAELERRQDSMVVVSKHQKSGDTTWSVGIRAR